MELKNLRNKDVAYLVGSFQSDGYFYKFIDKKRGEKGRSRSKPYKFE
jgi:hypothetical protein